MTLNLLSSYLLFSAVVILSAQSRLATAREYVGNVLVGEGQYGIFEFDEQRNPSRPVSSVAFHAAWPSAVKIATTIHVYGATLSSGRWSQVRRWSSVDGADYVTDGVVFEASATEPFGIGPAALTYDGTTFRLYYLVRTASGPGNVVGLATSPDGVSFTRQLQVYRAGAEAPGGISVSYACSDRDSHYLFLHAYASDLATANSFVATSKSPDGPYAFLGETIENDGRTGTFSGLAGNTFGSFSGALSKGDVIVLNDTRVESYIVSRVQGRVAYLDRPLEVTAAESIFASLTRNKVDLSFVEKTNEGWRGAITGYGHFPSSISEFTTPVMAPAVSGPWKVDDGYFLSPYFDEGVRSSENPEPVRASASCAAD